MEEGVAMQQAREAYGRWERRLLLARQGTRSESLSVSFRVSKGRVEGVPTPSDLSSTVPPTT